MNIAKLPKVLGLGAAIIAVTAGSALAATATASVNVRTGPGTQYRVVDTLRPGERVSIVDQAGGWCAVRANGPDGWVSCRYLSDRNYRTVRPGVRIELGIGNSDRKYRPHRPHRIDRDRGYWTGPGSSSYFGSGGYFGLSIGN